MLDRLTLWLYGREWLPRGIGLLAMELRHGGPVDPARTREAEAALREACPETQAEYLAFPGRSGEAN